ncbi:FUSC family protein [Thiotrichales bacterium 19S3-7]|nr:FUSC family protein [Thiotrichales bacterium 19S3-7]MCF6803085.1 FUSC family protein [Thiotrichales bacterium 19S3-11]
MKLKSIHVLRNIYESLEASVVALFCFILGNYLSSIAHDGKGYIDGIWCMISALVVLQSFVAETLDSSKARIAGTIMASIISGLCCIIFGYGYLSIFLSITLSVLVMKLFKYSGGVRIATATAAVITGYGFVKPEYSPVLNATMRSLDTLIGVGVSILVVYISYLVHFRKKDAIEI